jgi:hypothetical protein
MTNKRGDCNSSKRGDCNTNAEGIFNSELGGWAGGWGLPDGGDAGFAGAEQYSTESGAERQSFSWGAAENA